MSVLMIDQYAVITVVSFCTDLTKEPLLFESHASRGLSTDRVSGSCLTVQESSSTPPSVVVGSWPHSRGMATHFGLTGARNDYDGGLSDRILNYASYTNLSAETSTPDGASRLRPRQGHRPITILTVRS
ncbi:50kDa lectin [Giardia duodenalis assemblage B]|uniref:50kDa lectin n=1 Tax=Giardia duodenalis assemblage B TaxID=1394984 RepID=A0A132NQY0_GIAIN|nr:50kDa lectin [Giardia intestinalis assemblage B]